MLYYGNYFGKKFLNELIILMFGWIYGYNIWFKILILKWFKGFKLNGVNDCLIFMLIMVLF